MKLIEAEAKKILQLAKIAIPRSILISFKEVNFVDHCKSMQFPVLLKPQLIQGGRGKKGWIRLCESVDDVRDQITDLRQMIGDIPCAGFLFEEAVPHEKEYLVGMEPDHERGCYRATFSLDGGIAVSNVKTWPIVIKEDVTSIAVSQSIRNLFANLYDMMRSADVVRAEINPLAVLLDGSCVALDAKIELDDAATFRHPEWQMLTHLSQTGKRPSERETAYACLLERVGHRGTLGRYVEMDGDIAMVLSGGGASLVAIDALISAGGCPANYVEMSGNPDPDTVREASKIVFSKPGIKTVWIAGSFANFTDIQATVNAVLQAISDIGLRVPVVIRRDGPNAEAARADATAWGERHGIAVRFDCADVDLDESARAVVACI
ncbi:MAG: hypothetical protein NUV81_01835 [bacterium]|nr:hypothetical protein [bacterium]